MPQCYFYGFLDTLNVISNTGSLLLAGISSIRK